MANARMNAVDTQKQPSPAEGQPAKDPRRRRALISLILFLFLGQTLFATIATVDARAEGENWQVTYRADVNVSSVPGSLSIGTGGGALVPNNVRRSIAPLRGFNPGFGWFSVVFLLGVVLSFRLRQGAIYGGAVSLLGLIFALLIRIRIEDQVDALDWPGSLSVDFTPQADVILWSWALALGWHVIRWVLDRREERQPSP